jgi:hypothetical protein
MSVKNGICCSIGDRIIAPCPHSPSGMLADRYRRMDSSSALATVDMVADSSIEQVVRLDVDDPLSKAARAASKRVAMQTVRTDEAREKALASYGVAVFLEDDPGILTNTAVVLVPAVAGLRTKVVSVVASCTSFTTAGTASINDGVNTYVLGYFTAAGNQFNFMNGGQLIYSTGVNLPLNGSYFGGTANVAWSVTYYQAP